MVHFQTDNVSYNLIWKLYQLRFSVFLDPYHTLKRGLSWLQSGMHLMFPHLEHICLKVLFLHHSAVFTCIFIFHKPVLGGVLIPAKYIAFTWRDSQNQDSNFCSFLCSLFLWAIFIEFISNCWLLFILITPLPQANQPACRLRQGLIFVVCLWYTFCLLLLKTHLWSTYNNSETIFFQLVTKMYFMGTH